MQRIIQPFLILQLHDTRPSVVKETCQLIVWISKQYPAEFCLDSSSKEKGGGNGVKYFKHDTLPRLITSGNKLMQDLGHCTMCEILDGGPLIPKLMFYLIPFVNSKHVLMRV